MAGIKKKRKGGKGIKYYGKATDGYNPATSDTISMGGDFQISGSETLPSSPSSLAGPGMSSGPQSSSGGRKAARQRALPPRRKP